MKTLEDAMDCLVVERTENEDPSVRLLKMENMNNFGQDIAQSEKVAQYVAVLVEAHFSGSETVTSNDVLMFGLSAFASGLRVGVEMERM